MRKLIKKLEVLAEKCKDNGMGAVVVIVIVAICVLNEMDKRRKTELANA